MPVIKRIGTGSGYTVIENDCLQDMMLDIPERGLLVTMLSLPEGWEFSGLGLTSILPCGKSKVYSALKKLEDAGYLRRTRITDEKGRVIDWRYDICGRPIFREENNEKSEESPLTDFQEVDKKSRKSPLTDFRDLENRDLENEKVDKNKINNNKINNNKSINQDSNNNNINNITYRCDDLDSIDKIDIKKQLKYKQLVQEHSSDKKQIDSIVKILSEVMSARYETVRIAKEDKPIAEVRKRFSEITYEHVVYVLDSIRRQKKRPHNPKAYLLAALYNAPATIAFSCSGSDGEVTGKARERPENEKQYSFDLNDIKSLVNDFSDDEIQSENHQLSLKSL